MTPPATGRNASTVKHVPAAAPREISTFAGKRIYFIGIGGCGMSGRRGRRPGRSDTRSDILSAARDAFAEHGYDRATVRDIATRAGVDAAMVHHWFGTKERLFQAAVDVPFDPQELLLDGAPDDVARLGEHVVGIQFELDATPAPRAAVAPRQPRPEEVPPPLEKPGVTPAEGHVRHLVTRGCGPAA